MRKLALSFDPHIWVNVHSGMEVSGANCLINPLFLVAELICIKRILFCYIFQSLFWFLTMCFFSPFSVAWGVVDILFVQALFMPYDHRNTTPYGTASERMRSLLSKLNHAHCSKRCMVGSGGGSVGFVLFKLRTCVCLVKSYFSLSPFVLEGCTLI